MSPLRDTGNSPALGGSLGSFAVGGCLLLRPVEGLAVLARSLCWAKVALDVLEVFDGLPLRPVEGPALLAGSLCWAEVALDILEVFEGGRGVDVRPPAASDILLAAHNKELRMDLFDIS